MKTLITSLIITLFVCAKVQSQTTVSFDNKSKLNTKLCVSAAGASFIFAGLIKTPEQIWIRDDKGNIFGTDGKKGYWRDAKLFEDPTRWLPIASGICIISCAFIIKF
jgi:hypothetical protein